MGRRLISSWTGQKSVGALRDGRVMDLAPNTLVARAPRVCIDVATRLADTPLPLWRSKVFPT